MIAHYFKTHKPKSKIVVLDPKKKFSKQGLFTEGWAKLYAGMIDYHNVDNDGVVERINAKGVTLHTNFGKYKGDVINLIPPQKAGKIIKIKGSGGLSPTGADDFFHKQDALYADGWYRSISNDIWG